MRPSYFHLPTIRWFFLVVSILVTFNASVATATNPSPSIRQEPVLPARPFRVVRAAYHAASTTAPTLFPSEARSAVETWEAHATANLGSLRAGSTEHQKLQTHIRHVTGAALHEAVAILATHHVSH